MSNLETTIDMNAIVGTRDLLFLTLDTLRYDVAHRALEQGLTPHLQQLLPAGWEKRHTPGSFTYAAHTAFFAGFLPTPARPGKHPRLFAARFGGSETTASTTCVFDQADIVAGLRDRGYHTICLGGVGFFNQQTPLGTVLPSLFDHAEWTPGFGVTDPDSTRNQFRRAAELIAPIPLDQRIFVFINVSAIHQPNRHYLPDRLHDDLSTHQAALSYVDSCLPILVNALSQGRRFFCILCSDHGTAYGEDGFTGHRCGIPAVMDVPYAHFSLGDP
jgi:hypothetical protein